jgi:hypothetical protein
MLSLGQPMPKKSEGIIACGLLVERRTAIIPPDGG